MSIKAIKASLLSLAILLIDGGSLAALAANLTDADKDFMKNTAIASATEIKLGKVAKANSSNKEVLDFAATMISDHTKASDALKKVAAKDGLTLPGTLDAKHQEVVDRLAKLKGAAFDRDYAKQMAGDHKAVVASIESEEKTAPAPLKRWCNDTLPVVQGHLKMAEDMDHNLSH